MVTGQGTHVFSSSLVTSLIQSLIVISVFDVAYVRHRPFQIIMLFSITPARALWHHGSGVWHQASFLATASTANHPSGVASNLCSVWCSVRQIVKKSEIRKLWDQNDPGIVKGRIRDNQWRDKSSHTMTSWHLNTPYYELFVDRWILLTKGQ